MTASVPDSPVYASEVFGPVAPVIRFSSLDEAAALAGDTEYGLSLGILTRDVMAGLELANRIPSGMVHINDQTIGDEPNAPFGGVGSSGSGSRFGGELEHRSVHRHPVGVRQERDSRGTHEAVRQATR